MEGSLSAEVAEANQAKDLVERLREEWLRKGCKGFVTVEASTPVRVIRDVARRYAATETHHVATVFFNCEDLTLRLRPFRSVVK